MPATLLASQFETLEPLEPDEHGIAIDVDQNIDSIIESYVSTTGFPRNREGGPMIRDTEIHCGWRFSWRQLIRHMELPRSC